MSEKLLGLAMGIVITAMLTFWPSPAQADTPSYCQYGRVVGVVPVGPFSGGIPLKIQINLANATAITGTCSTTRTLVFENINQALGALKALEVQGAAVIEEIRENGNRAFQILFPPVGRSSPGSNISAWGGFFAILYSSSLDDRVPSGIRPRISVYTGGMGSPGKHLETEDAVRHNLMFDCLASPATVPNLTSTGSFSCDIPIP